MVWCGMVGNNMTWYGTVVIMDHKNIALLSTSSSYPPILTLFCAQYCFISHTLFSFEFVLFCFSFEYSALAILGLCLEMNSANIL